jgi:transposase
MKRVAKVLPVVKTPEHMTSQTCCRCGGHCGRHHTVEANRLNDHPWRGGRREIRGLRLCENSECRKPLNRDANAAVNIGTNFLRLYCGLPPIAAMTAEEATLTALQAAEPQEEETA